MRAVSRVMICLMSYSDASQRMKSGPVPRPVVYIGMTLLSSLNDRDAGSFASEGQQRTLALAMKLAQAQGFASGTWAGLLAVH